MNSNKCNKPLMSDEEIKQNYEHFESIIFENLLKVLETRPKNPVKKFARMILEDAGLDKNGDPIADKDPVSISNRVNEEFEADKDQTKKQKRKDDSDDEKPAEKEKKKSRKERKMEAEDMSDDIERAN